MSSFGYAPIRPGLKEPKATWWHALVVCWDTVDSTASLDPDRAYQDDFWAVQMDPLIRIHHHLEPADLVLPRGDGFFLVYYLERWGRQGEVPIRDIRQHSHPLLWCVLGFQEFLLKHPDCSDSRFIRGRVGAVIDCVHIYEYEAMRGGHWLAPVGRAFFLAARLEAAAPDGGALLHESLDLDGVTPLATAAGETRPLSRLTWSKEEISVKGFPERQRTWRCAPTW